MKKIVTIAALILTGAQAFCQQSTQASVHQLLSMQIRNVLEFAFTNTGTSTGNIVALPFNTSGDYKEGVSSPEQTLRIRSNKKFGIEVKASSGYFDYSGNSNPAPYMPVDEVLNMEVSSNGTGGNLQPPFTQGKFVSISENSKTILNNCHYGERQFSIKYKAAPGITYPVGSYSVDIIYTATQQ